MASDEHRPLPAAAPIGEARVNTLSTRLALMLGAAFAAIGAALLLHARMDADAPPLPELLAPVLIGAIAFALLSGLCVSRILGRRLRRLGDALDKLQRTGFAVPLRLPGADPGGDEIDRLAAQLEQIAERLRAQLETTQTLAAQRHDLLVNVSHDLRTPLASMQGYLELLLIRHGSLDADEQRAYIETAARQSERLGRLVGDLFDLTRLEDGALTPRCEDFPVAELAHDVAQKFSLDARHRQVSLQVDCSSEAGRVHADIGLVERVLENLVENALQHTPAGGSVTLRIARRAPRLWLEVADTGHGIAADELAHLFERYEHADRRGGRHVGLRLAITRHLVRLHGGELTVHSRVHEGSRFAFDLPLAA